MEIEQILVTLRPEIQLLRKRVKSRFDSLYDGWSNRFDEKFDNYSEWYGVFESSNKKKLLSCSRITYKVHGNYLPIELSEYDRFVCNESKACEVNNFLRKNDDKAIKMLSLIMSHIRKKGIKFVYCVVDEFDEEALKFNVENFGFKPIDRSIQFKSVTHTLTNKTVKWNILAQDEKTRTMLASSNFSELKNGHV